VARATGASVLVARYTGDAVTNDAAHLALRPLDGSPLTRFSIVDSDSEERETYDRIAAVDGAWREPAGYAVFAEWQVDDPEQYGVFEESRLSLFEVRQRHLPTFAFDWLLKRRDIPGRYLVLGLYGDEEGAARLCRLHPQVQRFAESHPASQYSARDVSGLCVCRVERSTI
jgi:hypothetical protein